MSINQDVKEKVEDFYNDLHTIFVARIEKNKKKIEDNKEEENNLLKKKNDYLIEINEIKEEPTNHINNNLDFHLLPNKYLLVDKYEKEIEYLEEELAFMTRVHEEEREELIAKNDNYIKELAKYFEEKENILKCILNREKFERLNQRAVHEKEIDNLKRINDDIINRYIKSEDVKTNEGNGNNSNMNVIKFN